MAKNEEWEVQDVTEEVDELHHRLFDDLDITTLLL